MCCRFEKWDVNEGEEQLEELCGGAVQFAIISYVFYHYMSIDTCYDWMAKWILRDDFFQGPDADIVSSRQFDLQPQIKNMEDRGVSVHKLMPQAASQDDRQLIFMPPHIAEKLEKVKFPTRPPSPITFPNVPYTDSKELSHFAADRHGNRGGNTRQSSKIVVTSPTKGSYVPPHRR